MRIISQPQYWTLGPKVAARQENIAIYRRLTGNKQLPADRGYWTLCNSQPPDQSGAEIIQLCESGFASKNQFFGVDWDEEIIEQNRRWHPDAHWHCGDWLKVIRQEEFNPALVYLDTTNFADHAEAAKLVSATMHLCPPKTVLLANVMLNDPRSSRRFKAEGLVRHIERYVGSLELKRWLPRVENYIYNGSSKTEMITYILYKVN